MSKGWSDYELEGRSPAKPERHIMQDTVDEMCRVMRETPDKFETTTFRVNFENGVSLWLSNFCEIWNGNTTEKVFTYEQARQLREAYDEAMQFKKTRTQEQIANKFKPKKAAYKPTHTQAECETSSSERRKNRDRRIGVDYADVPKKDKRWWEFWK